MKTILPKADSETIVAAIRAAEKTTSGEIRVHVEDRCWGNPLKRTRKLFKRLNMQNTRERNGVLIYLSLKSHKYAILGDEGINNQVEADFWNDVLSEMHPHFAKGAFVEGLCLGVERIGMKLNSLFPPSDDDVNELSDEISTA